MTRLIQSLTVVVGIGASIFCGTTFLAAWAASRSRDPVALFVLLDLLVMTLAAVALIPAGIGMMFDKGPGLAHLKGLTRLEVLSLIGTKVTDAGTEHLKRMTTLRSLNLSGTQVTNVGVKELRAALPKCKVLR